jgi:quercetin dioxygenase-like cupin family protein
MPDRIDDIVKISPDVHQVIFENQQIRMLRVAVKPGDKVPMHRNPENINYILKGGTLRLTGADGAVQDVAVTEGQVIPAPVSSHAVENVGATEVQTICVELKTST